MSKVVFSLLASLFIAAPVAAIQQGTISPFAAYQGRGRFFGLVHDDIHSSCQQLQEGFFLPIRKAKSGKQVKDSRTLGSNIQKAPDG